MLTLYAFDRRLTVRNDREAETFARHTLIVLQGRAAEATLPGLVSIDDQCRVMLWEPKDPTVETYMAEYRRAPRHAIAAEVLPFAQCSFEPDKRLIDALQLLAVKPLEKQEKWKPFWL